MDISAAILHLCPGSKWSLVGNDYSTLIWHGTNEPPTLEELTFHYAEMIKSDEKRKNIFQIIDQGFYVQPEEFYLAMGDNDRAMFSQMLSLVKEALELGLITNDTIQTIADKDGQKHQLTTLRFRQIMVAYGFYYKTLWDQLS